MTKKTLSAQLCHYIAEFPVTDLPAPTLRATSHALLDAVGVMLAASNLSDDVQPFIQLAATSDGPCQVLGTTLKSTPYLAAQANGAMAHALDFEDTFDQCALHPNASLIPAAIAMAEYKGNVDGSTFITALAIGCDLVCRMGIALRQPLEQLGWYPPLLLGAFGATAATARIAGLNAEQTCNALSLTLCSISAPGAIRHDTDTNLRATREAFAAEIAVRSVLLAELGVKGFAEPIEGKGGFFDLYASGHFDSAPLLDNLGTRFWGETLSYKPWPTCRGTHSFIELGLHARSVTEFDIHKIESIIVDTGEVQQMLVEPLSRKTAPSTVIDAKFSIPFTLALALVRGQVTLDDFTGGSFHAEEILSIARKIFARPRSDWGRTHATAGAITLNFTDGKSWHGEILQPLGHPDRPLLPSQLQEKFHFCAAQATTKINSSIAAEYLLNLFKKDQINFACLQKSH